MEYKITNIKLSVKCRNLCLDTVEGYLSENKIPFKKFNNYIVTKLTYTYIIFKKNIKSSENIYHINITKLDSFECLNESINNIKLMSKDSDICSYTIDNITVSTDFKKTINLLQLLNKLPNEISATYNSETFPGIFLKYKIKKGTAILFHTGKCVLLGCKNLNNIEYILDSLKTITA
jgi:hypothetical protein